MEWIQELDVVGYQWPIRSWSFSFELVLSMGAGTGNKSPQVLSGLLSLVDWALHVDSHRLYGLDMNGDFISSHVREQGFIVIPGSWLTSNSNLCLR